MRKYFAVLIVLAVSVPAMAHNRVVVIRPTRPVYMPSYRYYAPRPVYVYRPPVYYYRPTPIYVAPPVYQPAPVYANAPTARPPTSQPAIQLQIPDGFAETGRRYHKHGSDAGTIDWVRGTLNGKPVKIEYNLDGTVHEVKPD